MMGDSADARPLFSVIIPTYNRASLVTRAIRSVLEQERSDLEVVVVDDGSTDETARTVAELNDPRVRFLQQDQAGATVARNRGAASAGGTYLVFLDSDDELAPSWSSTFADAITEKVVLVSSDCWRRNLTGERTRGRAWDLGFVRPGAKALFQSGTYAVAGVHFRSSGGFDDELVSGHHTDLAFRLLPKLPTSDGAVVHIGEPLVVHHLGAPHSIRKHEPALLQGAEQMIERHRALLRRNPVVLADYHGVAGVAAARLGDGRRARRHFALAARYAPGDLKRWARVLLAAAPGGSRFWKRGDR